MDKDFIFTNVEYFKELSPLCVCFVDNLAFFEWENDDYNFKIKVYPRDRLGYIQVDFFLRSLGIGYYDDTIYCECSLTFELGQIEKLSNQILYLINVENYSVEIEALD